ncbi:M20 metallopeptidase family protein [Fundicoccus culcitae]|uniref:Amidohydrolase n=1 Tax=Fundicoccus culcitae TaxID=2969821 RepID=A0ABY5P4S6_9LACT|nr:amidohydrolase [Fundicoccus culcitae]UUX33743.1 amidohydrolase [Fundicoccus culcitae]
MSILERVDSYKDYAISLRHYLHTHPEVSGNEYETAAYLKKQIEAWGLPIQQASNTGFIVTLDTGRPGKTLALRTELDALPVTESTHNLKVERTVISENPGFMHACGHDLHMATLMSVMQILIEMKDQLSGKIIFIFEEAEETASGIKVMMKFLKENNIHIDAFYGNHVAAHIDLGKIVVNDGPNMSGAMITEFTVHGKSGHGSRPDQAISPIFAMAQILNAVASAWVNQIDVEKTVTLGMGQVHSGNAVNIIPETAFANGTLRYFDEAEGHKALEVFKKVATLTGEAHNCRVEFSDRTGVAMPATINDSELAKIARQSVLTNFSEDTLITDQIWFGSESFAYYKEIAPIVFTFVGTKDDEKGIGADHHTAEFDVDDSAMRYTIATMVQFTLDYLNQ